MHMEWLQIQRVRNLENIQISPGPQINIFTGKNASGKTAVLEAIFLLSRARSFRTPRIQDVIQHKQESLLVSAKIQHENAGLIKTGIKKRYGEVIIKRNGEKIKTVSNQASQLPIVLITQESQTLITGAPKQRRHWLDWAMFHVEPDYLRHWKTYIKALRQRNALLKNKIKNKDLYRGWEEAMVESSYALTKQRRRFLNGLKDALSKHLMPCNAAQINIKLSPGWPDKKGIETVLENGRNTDMNRGYTRAGIHQADIEFTSKNKRIASIYSRGEVKQFATFLLFAQAKEIESRTGIKPIIIIDDFSAELDLDASKHLLTWLQNERFQSFLTTAEFNQADKKSYPYQRFHVKQGKISNISKA